MIQSPTDSPGISSNNGSPPLHILISCFVVGVLFISFSLIIDMHLCSLGIQLLMCVGVVLVIWALSGKQVYAVFKKYDLEIRGVALAIIVMIMMLFAIVHLYARSNEMRCKMDENVVIKSWVQIESAHAQSASQKSESDGWVYVGIKFGQSWDERYFTWDGYSKGPPEKGKTLTATGTVHLREDHIRYTEDEGWVNSTSVGIIKPGNRVKVLDTKTVADGFHWVKIRRLQNEKKK